jgi:hypothetical protein
MCASCWSLSRMCITMHGRGNAKAQIKFDKNCAPRRWYLCNSSKTILRRTEHLRLSLGHWQCLEDTNSFHRLVKVNGEMMSPSELLKINACVPSSSRAAMAHGSTWKLFQFHRQATFLRHVFTSRYCNEAASPCNGEMVYWWLRVKCSSNKHVNGNT